jgi:hypothetical protein
VKKHFEIDAVEIVAQLTIAVPAAAPFSVQVHALVLAVQRRS